MANTRPVRGTTAFAALSAAGSGRRTSAGRESISATDSTFPQWSERRSGFLRGRAGVGSALGCRHKPARRRTEGDLAARKGGSRRLLFPRPDAAARFQRGAVPGRRGDAGELEFDGRAPRICGGRWPQEFHPYFEFWRKGQPHYHLILYCWGLYGAWCILLGVMIGRTVLETISGKLPEAGNEDVDEPLKTILRRCVAPDAADRYGSVGELRRELMPALESLGTAFHT